MEIQNPAQIPVTPVLPVQPDIHIKEKFPDPLEKKVPITDIQANSTTQSKPPLVNKRFWRIVLIFLVLLPVLSGVVVFAYQTYLNLSLSTQPTQSPPLPTINPLQVVTPEMLPLASSSAQLLPGWKRHTQQDAGYSFQYPEAWFVVNTKLDSVEVQNFDSTLLGQNATSSVSDVNKISIEFKVLPLKTQITTRAQLVEFVKALDQQEPLRITVSSESSMLSDSGLDIYQRIVNKGTSLTNYPEAYTILDKHVLQVSIDGGTTNNPSIFEQIVKTLKLSQVDKNSATSEWKVYENIHGYSLRYPSNIIVRSNDKTEPGSNDLTKALSISAFTAADIQNGLGNNLSVELSDAAPTQSATQSGTRDFGTREFKFYESENQVRYLGQLASGNWMQITLVFNSNIDQRVLLNQIIDTITLKEPALP